MTETLRDDRPPSAPSIPHDSPLIDQVRRRMDARSPAGGTRFLLLGPVAAALGPELRGRGCDVREPGTGSGESDLRDLAATSPGAFDGVIALGFLERMRWDRWALQQIHRVLADGGTLLLAVPDLYSLRFLADPRYVAGKVAKLLSRRPGAAPREAVHSYPAPRLRAMIGRLGFDVTSWSGVGPERGSAWPPTHHLVQARKRTPAPGSSSVAPDPTSVIREFETEHREFLARRDRWRAGASPEPLEPGRYAGARVLVLAPHPDDELVGCGGTLLRLAWAGAKVTVVQATDGSASAALDDAPDVIRRTIRLEEARAVAEAAGFGPTIFWREDNRAFRAREELVGRLRETLRDLRPALVFTPFVDDIHPDHQTLNRVLAAALDGLPEDGMRVLGYEVWSLVPANLWCDVTACVADLERLFLLYETAMKVDDLIHMSVARNRAHALQLGVGAAYAEAFHAADPMRFREMTDRGSA
jgi:LmbE family N-acetylglucosaminyl deacetylase